MDKSISSLMELKESLRSLSKAARSSFRVGAGDLAAAYTEQVDHAPRRARPYFSPTRHGITSSRDASGRAEEHLAVGLFMRGELQLPSGEPLKLLDYQFPLKCARADVGIGKIDLLGLCKTGTLAVVELKCAGNREDRRIALVEGLIYAAIVEANIERIAAEALAVKEVHVTRARPKILVIAPSDYWSSNTTIPSAKALDLLATDVARTIPIGISLLCLSDAHLVAFGLNGRPPQVSGHARLSSAVDGANDVIPLQRSI